MTKKLIPFALTLFCAFSALHAQSVRPLVQPAQSFVDASGMPCAGCSLYTYVAGTTTPLATYTDSSGSVQNTNPIILDVAGRASIWVSPGTAYKFALKDTSGNPVWTADNVTSPLGCNAPGGNSLIKGDCNTAAISDSGSALTATEPLNGTSATFSGTVSAGATSMSGTGVTFPDTTQQTSAGLSYPSLETQIGASALNYSVFGDNQRASLAYASKTVRVTIVGDSKANGAVADVPYGVTKAMQLLNAVKKACKNCTVILNNLGIGGTTANQLNDVTYIPPTQGSGGAQYPWPNGTINLPISSGGCVRATNVVTCTTANTALMQTGYYYAILGVTNDTSFNTNHAQMTVVNSTTFTYASTGADGTATGTSIALKQNWMDAVQATQPDVLMISFGTNDAPAGTTLLQFIGNLTAARTTALTWNPAPTVVFDADANGSNNATLNPTSYAAQANYINLSLGTVQACQNTGVICFDAYRQEAIARDGIDPQLLTGQAEFYYSQWPASYVVHGTGGSLVGNPGTQNTFLNVPNGNLSYWVTNTTPCWDCVWQGDINVQGTNAEFEVRKSFTTGTAIDGYDVQYRSGQIQVYDSTGPVAGANYTIQPADQNPTSNTVKVLNTGNQVQVFVRLASTNVLTRVINLSGDWNIPEGPGYLAFGSTNSGSTGAVTMQNVVQTFDAPSRLAKPRMPDSVLFGTATAFNIPITNLTGNGTTATATVGSTATIPNLSKAGISGSTGGFDTAATTVTVISSTQFTYPSSASGTAGGTPALVTCSDTSCSNYEMVPTSSGGNAFNHLSSLGSVTAYGIPSAAVAQALFRTADNAAIGATATVYGNSSNPVFMLVQNGNTGNAYVNLVSGGTGGAFVQQQNTAGSWQTGLLDSTGNRYVKDLSTGNVVTTITKGAAANAVTITAGGNSLLKGLVFSGQTAMTTSVGNGGAIPETNSSAKTTNDLPIWNGNGLGDSLVSYLDVSRDCGTATFTASTTSSALACSWVTVSSHCQATWIGTNLTGGALGYTAGAATVTLTAATSTTGTATAAVHCSVN